MAVDIIVVRDPGDRRGPDIADPLINNIPLAIQRGTGEIDAVADAQPVTVQCIPIPGLDIGMTVQVMDGLQASVWRGKVTGLEYTVQGNKAMVDITILKPGVFK